MSGLVPGAVIAGKYRLERIVGRGGMGAVWAAKNRELDMPVAMKFIEAAEGADLADARARFEREARTAAQIRSPHVAQIIDHGVDGDRPFIAMELLEGEDLSARLRREGRLSLPAVAKILTQSAKALRRAHEAGIIHRDLKPGNIFLARYDDDEIVKILDFGVAKVQGRGALESPLATQTGVVFGSPTYMSPEQARGVRTLDHRTDLWSMAVIVFRAITGVKPFDASSIGDLVVKLCIDPLPVATTIAPDLPLEVDAFFSRAFARDLGQRFSSAVDMAAAFEVIAGAGAATAATAPAPSIRTPWPAQQPAAPASLGPVFAPPPALGTATGPFPPGAVAGNSGAHVAFAPGTLTPPPGVASGPSAAGAVQPAPPPSAPSVASPGWPAPESARALPPPPSGAAPLPPLPASPPRARDPRVLAGGLGLTAAALLAVVLVLVARHGRTDARASAPAALATDASPAVSASTSVEAPAAAASAPANAAAPATATADSSATPAPDPSATAPSAEPVDSARARPEGRDAAVTKPTSSSRAPTKPGKRRPNFGY